MKIAYVALALITALAIGGLIGWHAKGVSVTAASSAAAQAEVTQVTNTYQQQAAQQNAALVEEQSKTTALNAQQAIVQGASADIHLEIDHAVLLQPEPLGIAASCPDPIAGGEFERLYERAAQGADRPAAASSTGPG